MANYFLDIVILLTAAVVAVPLFRAAGFRDEHYAHVEDEKPNVISDDAEA